MYDRILEILLELNQGELVYGPDMDMVLSESTDCFRLRIGRSLFIFRCPFDAAFALANVERSRRLRA